MDYEAEYYRKEADRLRVLGYELTSDAHDYRVNFKGKFVYAAGNLTKKKKHWRHARADATNNFRSAVREAQRHEDNTKKTI